MIMKKVILFFLSLMMTGVMTAQTFCIPNDSLSDFLKDHREYEGACRLEPEALRKFALACAIDRRLDLAIQCLKKASELGDAAASMELGTMHVNPRYKTDTVLAMKYLELALKQDKTGRVHASYGMLLEGEMPFYQDFGKKLRHSKNDSASTYYLKGAKMGDSFAQACLAQCYFKGDELKQDYQQAKFWVDKVLAHPDTITNIWSKAMAKEMLLEMYEKGLGVKRNLKKVLDIHVADSNWIKVAECYATGYGVKKNAKKAAHYYVLALSKKYAPDEDYEKAATWLQENANQKDTAVLFSLGNYFSKKATQEDSNLSYEYWKQSRQHKSFSGASIFHEKAFEYWESAANKGHIEAIKTLVNKYRFGDGVKVDSVKAAEWVRKGVSISNDKDLLFDMAWYNAKGIGMPINEAEAVKWYHKAVEAGHTTAAVNLGWCYDNAFGCEADYVKAAKYNKIAADAGEPLGFNNLGFAYIRGRGVPVDHEKGINLIALAIEKGYTQNIGTLFNMLNYGTFDVTPNPQKGAEVFRHLDDKLNHSNLDCLGYLNFFTKMHPNLATDSTEMIRRYTLALKDLRPYQLRLSDTESALNELGHLLETNNHTTSKDFVETLEWMRAKSKEGNSKVSEILIQLLEARPELTTEPSEAFNIVKRLAEGGDNHWQFQLAWKYEQGIGVPIDSVKAVELYTLAAENGNAQAYYQLGKMYLFGNNVEEGLKNLTALAESHQEFSGEAAMVLAEYYWKNNEFEQIITLSKNFKSKTGAYDNVLSFYRAMMLMKQGKTAEAYKVLEHGWRYMSYPSFNYTPVYLKENSWQIIADFIPVEIALTDEVKANPTPKTIAKLFNMKEEDILQVNTLDCDPENEQPHIIFIDVVTREKNRYHHLNESTTNEVFAKMYGDFADLLISVVGYPEKDICYIAYEKALEHDPNNALYLNNYAYELSKHNSNLDKALEMSAKAISIESNNYHYLDTYAWLLYQTGKYDEAKKYMDKCLILLGEKQHYDIYYHAGDIYFRCGEKEKAIHFWENIVDQTYEDGIRKSLLEKIKSASTIEQ